MLNHIKKHFLLYTVVPLLILTIGASYYRFMVSYDYLVRYEGVCDPYVQSCHLYCEDEACTEPFYYTWITRSAATLNELCTGGDVTECAAADACLANETHCSIEFCDPDASMTECETLDKEDRPRIQSDLLDFSYPES